MPFQIANCVECQENDAKVTCIKCEENLCQECDRKRHNSEKMKTHLRYPYEIIQKPSSYCNQKGHEDVALTLYCAPCKSPICSTCNINNHKSHLVVSLVTAVQSLKTELKENLCNLQEQTLKLEKDIVLLEKELQIKRDNWMDVQKKNLKQQKI